MPESNGTSLLRKIAYWLSLFLIFTLPWENIVVLKGIGTIGKISGLAVAAFWLFVVIVTGKFREPRPFHLLVWLFVLWHVSSVYWTIDLKRTVSRLQTYIQLAGFVYILWDLYTTPDALRGGLQMYVLGAWVSVYSLLDNFFSGVSAYTGRYVATGFDPNNIGVILALGIPLAWHLATSAGGSNRLMRILKVINYAYIPAAILGIVLTASRGALFTTAPALLFVIGSMTRLKPIARILVFMALIGTLYLLQPLVPQESIDRLSTTEDQVAQGDLNGRVAIWREGFDIFKDHPILGIGSFAFRSAATRANNVAHNSFLTVLVEVGVIGFSIFTLIMAIVISEALRHPQSYLRVLWLTLLVVLAIGVFSLNWAHRKQAWLFPSLVIVSAGLSVQDNKSSQSSLRHKKGIPPGKTQWPQSAFIGSQPKESKRNKESLQPPEPAPTIPSRESPNAVG